ncbi:MAG TPA: hypothetical protein VGD23_00980 [Sphingomicrobium sp.]
MNAVLVSILLWLAAGQPTAPARLPEFPTNAEMSAMYQADQAARKVADIDWAKLDLEDEVRRKRTRALLDAGALRSGDDYFHAAYIFQHGSEPSDYLLAHVLAVAAMKRGREDASWIAAATLDRYLQRIGQPQVLGTQYRCPGGQPSMDPYQADLIPDSIREAVDVPVRAEQVERGKLLCGGGTKK